MSEEIVRTSENITLLKVLGKLNKFFESIEAKDNLELLGKKETLYLSLNKLLIKQLGKELVEDDEDEITDRQNDIKDYLKDFGDFFIDFKEAAEEDRDLSEGLESAYEGLGDLIGVIGLTDREKEDLRAFCRNQEQVMPATFLPLPA
jgi:hypothetical protein